MKDPAKPSKPKKLRAKGRTSAKQFVTAQRRIEQTKESGATVLDLSDLPKLGALPLELAGVTALQRHDLRGTQVSDLSVLAGLTGLQDLYLMATDISYLAPLARLNTSTWGVRRSVTSPPSPASPR